MRCEDCLRRINEMETQGKKAQEVYEVGNIANVDMGHQYYFTKEGKIALCVAKRRV